MTWLLWLIVGLAVGVGFMYLNRHPGGLKFRWFDWVLLALAVVFFALALLNYSGSMEELEPNAATIMLLLFGLPGLILAAIVGVRVWRTRLPTA